VTGQDAKIAFHAGQIDLVDLAGKQQTFRRYETRLESCHALASVMSTARVCMPGLSTSSDVALVPVNIAISAITSLRYYRP
jgi:hypothetical protein